MNVLFVCRANVGRSQMAEAFFNKLSKGNMGISAGTDVFGKEGEKLHEFVIKSMKEKDCDLSDKRRKQLTKEMFENADKVVVITEKNRLPDYAKNSEKVIFWDVDDGKDKDLEFHRKMRDAIEKLVERLVKEIG